MREEYERICENYEHIMSESGISRPEDITVIRDVWFSNIKDFEKLDTETKQLVGKLSMIISKEREPKENYKPMWEIKPDIEDVTFPNEHFDLSANALMSAIDSVMQEFDDSDARLDYIIRNFGYVLTIREVYNMVPLEKKNYCRINKCVYDYLMNTQ